MNDILSAPTRNPQYAVDLDLPATAAAFAKGWHKLSWSKLNTYRRCQASWFFENYAVPLHRQVYSEDSQSAIPGTLTQRVWEAVINERVYERFPFLDDLYKWMEHQTTALFHTIVFPMETQFEHNQQDWRKYFRTDAGKARLQLMAKEHGLDPMFFKGIQPKFTDLTAFGEKHKSVELFLAKLSGQYQPMLEKFIEKKVDLRKMLSEQFIRAKFGPYELNGGVDFLYNTRDMTEPLTKLAQLQEDYIILDGKAQVHGKTQNGQLFFYATVLHMVYRKMPSYVGFIDWSKSDFVWFPFKPDYVSQTKRSIMLMQSNAHQLNESLQRMVKSGQKTISMYELPFLNMTAERMACLFCGMSNACEEAHKAGYSRIKPADYIKPAKQTIEVDSVQPSKDGISEVSF